MTEPTGGDDLRDEIERRVQELDRARAWPWQQPGAVSVGLDDDGNLVEVTVADDGTVTERPLGEEGSP